MFGKRQSQPLWTVPNCQIWSSEKDVGPVRKTTSEQSYPSTWWFGLQHTILRLCWQKKHFSGISFFHASVCLQFSGLFKQILLSISNNCDKRAQNASKFFKKDRDRIDAYFVVMHVGMPRSWFQRFFFLRKLLDPLFQGNLLNLWPLASFLNICGVSFHAEFSKIESPFTTIFQKIESPFTTYFSKTVTLGDWAFAKFQRARPPGIWDIRLIRWLYRLSKNVFRFQLPFWNSFRLLELIIL